MKVCDRCLKRDPEAQLMLIIKGTGVAPVGEWDFCKSCVKEVAAWITKGNATKEEPVKLADAKEGKSK